MAPDVLLHWLAQIQLEPKFMRGKSNGQIIIFQSALPVLLGVVALGTHVALNGRSPRRWVHRRRWPAPTRCQHTTGQVAHRRLRKGEGNGIAAGETRSQLTVSRLTISRFPRLHCSARSLTPHLATVLGLTTGRCHDIGYGDSAVLVPDRECGHAGSLFHRGGR